jgi:DnaJ-class molecular chaperone
MSKKEKVMPGTKPAKSKPGRQQLTAPGSPHGNPLSKENEGPGKRQVCPSCSGQGYRLENSVRVRCSTCGGHGYLMNVNS